MKHEITSSINVVQELKLFIQNLQQSGADPEHIAAALVVASGFIYKELLPNEDTRKLVLTLAIEVSSSLHIEVRH